MSRKIFNQTENDEHIYLERTKEKIKQTIANTDEALTARSKEIRESKDYLWENKAGMDHVEKVAVRQSINQIALSGENAAAKKKRLAKLIRSPYFGRIDFAENDHEPSEPLYIGIHSFFDQKENMNVIHDWRAPVSGMFYDFELGSAYFDAPSGRIEGNISLKRQYRIRDGILEFMIESSLNIHDDILQKELSQNSSEKMKNIVATIQRDQNTIIRNEHSQVLIIQGVAGSGKTSIALHRIAFLLYRFKETIKSEDILIISPNKVFADYISNVLPELGEEKIRETSMEELAAETLENKYKFQSFSEQVSSLLEKPDEKYQERIRFKSSFEFISRLNEFLVYFENEYFKPVDFVINRNPVPANYLKEKYKTYHRLPIMKRIAAIVGDVVNDIHFYNNYQVIGTERNQVRREIEKMFRTLNIRQIYKDFYEWLGKPELLKQARGSIYEYADVFPLIYLKIALEGTRSYEKVKHLVVDEMQDYTPLQYHVIHKLFPCNKTILGDVNQSVNPYSSSGTEEIGRIFPQADRVKMLKSYRSSYEIVEFVQNIKNNPEIEIIERHGEKPVISECRDEKGEIEELGRLVKEFKASSNKSLGIICKTQKQADKLYGHIRLFDKQSFLLNAQSAIFANGVIVSTAYMAKGLEFDQVIIPFANSRNYKTETDRQMLYVAATRAMHKLILTYSGERTGFI